VRREIENFSLLPILLVWTTIVQTAIVGLMASAIARAKAKNKGRRFDSLHQEAYLALWRTYDRLRVIEDELFAGFELTAQQYNLLRLLQAAHHPVPTLALAERLISRAPDITRMIDKLENRGLIVRTRSKKDRREVLVDITAAGHKLLDRITGPLKACHEQQLGHLSTVDLKTLVGLLHAVRAPHEPVDSVWR
jgi:DNA-binding MarR family transcriptional regulator